MKKIILPQQNDWDIKRPLIQQNSLEAIVKQVFNEVQSNGDEAVRLCNVRYDRNTRAIEKVSQQVIAAAANLLSEDLKKAINMAASNIRHFHAAQIGELIKVETMPGVTCWQENRPIEHVGLYIPGGTAPLFSTVLMLGIPAKLAACKHVVLCTPADSDGNINPAVLYAADIAGIDSIFGVGGIQAIAALAIGTETIPKADKIFGPGNQYVTAAKAFAQQTGTAIDLPAGPSEVLIIADKNCNPIFVAADLLAQAEHGTDSQVILLSDSNETIDKCLEELQTQLQALPRRGVAIETLKNSKAILLDSISSCVDFSNQYAPEHLILAIEDPLSIVSEVINAGSVFLGNFSCESAGDYASGTNHTLPTNGRARSYGGVSTDSFLKKITFQQITVEGIQNIGPGIELMAEAEQLWGHKNAVTVRLKTIYNV